MTNPTISIVIACFNARATLAAALDSLLAQSYPNVEIIVVDGASHDGTVELIQSYSDRISTWISEPDTGIYDAWNKGVRLAKGEWIGFLGADDVYLPNALQIYADYIGAHPGLEFVSGHVELFNELGKTRVIGEPWHWARFRRFMCVAHVGSLHARNLFENHGHYDTAYRVCGDYELLLRAGAGLRAGFVNTIISRMKSGGVSGTNRCALDETRRAKVNTNAVTPLVAGWDSTVAAAKWQLRDMLGRL